MTRYAPEHKDETRQKILDAAAKLFRSEGYAASGVAKVMGAAELTVGGFYAHFASKEALLAEVMSRSLEMTRTVLMAGLEETRGFPFVREVARRYLSRLHRDLPSEGCALPPLLPEISRQTAGTKEVLEDYLQQLVAEFEERLPGDTKLSKRDRALALVALLTGGMALARAVKSPELSDRILLACRRFAVAEDEK